MEICSLGEAFGTWPPEGARTAMPDGSAGQPPSRIRRGGSQEHGRGTPEDRIVHLLLTQPTWWDQLTAEDHDLLHALPAPHGELLAWLERDIVEHGPRPWAAVRTALAAQEPVAAALAALRLDDNDDYDAGPVDLRLLLDGRLLDALEARQRDLATAAASDPDARAEYQASLVRAQLLRARINAARQASSA